MSAVLAAKHDINNWSQKRIMQTSAPHNTDFDALDSCAGLRAMPDCEYAYTTEDHRVVSFWVDYNNGDLVRGQKSVRVPNPRT